MMEKRHIFKKHLGQNFLHDKNIVRKIEKLIGDGGFCALEIGPGGGSITKTICKKYHHVTLVEKDKSLISGLQDLCRDYSSVIILNMDILNFTFEDYYADKKVSIFGNIPYNITTPIFEFLTKNRKYISSIFLMVQKEVVDRLLARPSTRAIGSISLYMNYYWNIKKRFLVKPGSFYPLPKVESVYISLEPLQRKEGCNEELLFEIIRGLYSQRRKMIRGTLPSILEKKNIKIRLDSLLKEIGIRDEFRPEDISLEQFINLTQRLSND